MPTNMDQMKTSTASKLEISILLFTLFMGPGAYLINVPALNSFLGFERDQVNGITFSSFDGNYTEHAPIFINDNGDFEALGFNGSGTSEDPYLMEGLNFTSSTEPLITISGTNSYFTFRNILVNGLNGDFDAVHLTNVENGIFDNITISGVLQSGIVFAFSSNNNAIINSTIHDTGAGIALDGTNNVISDNIIYRIGTFGIFTSPIGSNNNSITGNEIFEVGQGHSGIALEGSTNNIVTDNVIHDTDGGFSLGNSDYNYIVDNILTNTGAGMILDGSNYNVLSGNNISNNINQGIELFQQSDYNTISENKIHDNELGISISSNGNVITHNEIFNNKINSIHGDNNTISGNIFHNNKNPNDPAGIRLESDALDNVITSNDFRDNSFEESNIWDDGQGNEFHGNFYSDWSHSGSYNVGGFGGSMDLTPKENPNHMSLISLTIENNGSLSLEGDVLISWNGIDDTYDHSQTYSVLYSPDGGSSWITLISDLIKLNYTLDTSIIVDGTNVIFSVQGMDEVGFVTQTITDETYLIANSVHILSLLLNTPNGVQSGTISLSWEKTDSWGHEIVYDVFLSNNNGTTWELLTSDLVSTTFDWDTTTVENGNYLIKVVAKDIDGTSVEDFSLSFVIENIVETTPSASETTTSSSSPDTSNEAPLNLGITGIFFAGLVLALITFTRKKNY